MRRVTGQLDLFAPKPRNFDEAALLRRLREAEQGPAVVGPGMSRTALRRLMTPLPAITVLR